MGIPLSLLGLTAGLGGMAVSTGANLYSQSRQRDLYRYQRSGYERQLNDWNKNVGSQGRNIRYPELSYQGAINRLSTDIDTSYASSVGSVGGSIGHGTSRITRYLGD